jgi:tetratricopeptide (TPR) repeat protein
MKCRWLRWVLLVWLAAPAFADDPSPEALIRAGHWKRARPLVESRVGADPNDARAAYLLSQIREAYRDLDGALLLAQKAVALDGRNAPYHFQLAEVCGEMAEIAGGFKRIGLARRFKSEAEIAAGLDPKFLDAREGLMEFYLQAPGIIGGSKSMARQMADEVARLDPVQGNLLHARLASVDKDLPQQESFLQKAYQAKPNDYGIVLTLMQFYQGHKQDFTAAEKYARAAVQIDPSRVQAYTAMAAIYSHLQRWSELDAILTQAEKSVPDDFSPYYLAGRSLLLEGHELARAERYFRKYLTQEPEGDAPGVAPAHWRLGLVLEHQGQKAEAIREIELAVQLDPSLNEAKKDLKRLK